MRTNRARQTVVLILALLVFLTGVALPLRDDGVDQHHAPLAALFVDPFAPGDIVFDAEPTRQVFHGPASGRHSSDPSARRSTLKSASRGPASLSHFAAERLARLCVYRL